MCDDGKQSRCFTWVGDAVRALIDLSIHPQAVGEVFNGGSDREVTILELAERVKELASSSSEIVFVPYDRAYEEGFEDMRRLVPDLTKIRNWIGYKETLDLSVCVQRAVGVRLGTTALEFICLPRDLGQVHLRRLDMAEGHP